MGKVAYLDCASGISGDMTLAALVDAGVPLERAQRGHRLAGAARLPAAGPGSEEERLSGTQITVEYQPEHTHRHLHQILAMIDAGQLTPRQKDLARRIFTRLAEAEAKVHGTPIEKVHFHEVGAADSIADIVGTAVGWDLLGVERIVASPVPTGTGRIRIAHGECSIPAPATAELLRGIPLAESAIRRRIDHAHRGRHPGHAGRCVRPAAGDDDRADRLRGRPEGFCRAAQYAAAAGGRSG